MILEIKEIKWVRTQYVPCSSESLRAIAVIFSMNSKDTVIYIIGWLVSLATKRERHHHQVSVRNSSFTQQVHTGLVHHGNHETRLYWFTGVYRTLPIKLTIQ